MFCIFIFIMFIYYWDKVGDIIWRFDFFVVSIFMVLCVEIYFLIIFVGGYMKISVCVIVDFIKNFVVKCFILFLSGFLGLLF